MNETLIYEIYRVSFLFMLYFIFVLIIFVIFLFLIRFRQEFFSSN